MQSPASQGPFRPVRRNSASKGLLAGRPAELGLGGSELARARGAALLSTFTRCDAGSDL